MNKSIFTSRRYIAILVALLIGVVAMVVGNKRKHYITDAGVVWTTEYHITYEARHSLSDSIIAIFNAIDMSASPYNEKSLVTRINNNATSVVDSLFAKLYNASLYINKESGGAFDPTVMPLVNAWGFGYKSGSLPTQATLDSLLSFTGINKTRLEGDSVIKSDNRIKFDFSSIAKGLACDEVAAMLRRNGAENFVVEIGGEVVVSGKNARGLPWHVSVDLPADNDSTVDHYSTLLIELNRGAVATSGSYRKNKTVGGRKVSHIINPLTGQADVSSLLSVTIIAADCMTADAWATACMVMGLDKTMQLAQKHPELGVMTISADDDGNYVVWANATFTNHVVPAEPS